MDRFMHETQFCLEDQRRVRLEFFNQKIMELRGDVRRRASDAHAAFQVGLILIWVYEAKDPEEIALRIGSLLKNRKSELKVLERLYDLDIEYFMLACMLFRRHFEQESRGAYKRGIDNCEQILCRCLQHRYPERPPPADVA